MASTRRVGSETDLVARDAKILKDLTRMRKKNSRLAKSKKVLSKREHILAGFDEKQQTKRKSNITYMPSLKSLAGSKSLPTLESTTAAPRIQQGAAKKHEHKARRLQRLGGRT